jgi:hypothetical protein
MTKKLCRAMCDELHKAPNGGRPGRIIIAQRELCYKACESVGSGATKKMWCTALGAKIRHLGRHPGEGYKGINNKQLMEQLLILYNTMGCPPDDTLEDIVNG